MTNRRKTCGLLLAPLAALLALAGPARAEGPEDQAPSLKLVPADAAFYSVTLRGKEQLQAVLKSNAWKKLTAIEAVQEGWKKVKEKLDDPDGPWATFNKDPQNRELLALLGQSTE